MLTLDCIIVLTPCLCKLIEHGLFSVFLDISSNISVFLKIPHARGFYGLFTNVHKSEKALEGASDGSCLLTDDQGHVGTLSEQDMILHHGHLVGAVILHGPQPGFHMGDNRG